MPKSFPTHLDGRLQNYKPYAVLKEVRSSLKKSLREIEQLDSRVISLQPEGPCQGRILYSYINNPFFLKPGETVSNAHTHYWESLQMAKTFLDFGYQVDVINWRNNRFIPQEKYSFFIDVRYNLERIAPWLNEDCVKIMHIDTAHWLFHNTAEMRRLLDLQQRRGVTLRPRRYMEPNWAIEHADCATILGNEFTMNTYEYANKPIYRVPISTPVLHPWPAEKNFETCRKNFLWFSSGGMVHKGLDLVLEAFAALPEGHLTICGPVNKEKDFEAAFFKELYQTPNIHTIGWVDISSPKFMEILNNCVALIHPSCSEGGGGSVITCMHAGLIPIVSYESSVDVADSFGVTLKSCWITEIKDAVRLISGLPAQELKRMARQTWEFARANHTREKFAEEYKKIVAKIISTYRNGEVS